MLVQPPSVYITPKMYNHGIFCIYTRTYNIYFLTIKAFDLKMAHSSLVYATIYKTISVKMYGRVFFAFSYCLLVCFISRLWSPVLTSLRVFYPGSQWRGPGFWHLFHWMLLRASWKCWNECSLLNCVHSVPYSPRVAITHRQLIGPSCTDGDINLPTRTPGIKKANMRLWIKPETKT